MFPAEPLLPQGARRAAYLDAVLEHLDRASGFDPQEALRGFLGRHADAETLHIDAADHVAVYVGDYEHEGDFEDWVEAVRSHPDTDDVRTGPSHIAPRHHGAPGHWVNFQLGGSAAELFACRRLGAWADRPCEDKAALMSHLAVSVDAPGHVLPVLEYLAHYPSVELLSYSPTDELGHTYGHLIDRSRPSVLELVFPGE